MVAVLTGDRDALHPLRRQCGDDAARGAVIGGNDRVHRVVLSGQDLLHIALSVGGEPAVRIGLGHDGDVARVDGGLKHLLLTAAEEVRVRVGGGALDHHILALRLGGEHRAGLHPPDLDIVEGEVEGARILDQAVIADDRNSFVSGSLNGGADGLRVLREDDQRVDALGDQAFHVGKLLGGGRLRVCGNIGGARRLQRGLDRRFVGFPAFFLKIRPADADCLRMACGLRSRRQTKAERRRSGDFEGFHAFLPVLRALLRGLTILPEADFAAIMESLRTFILVVKFNLTAAVVLIP